MASAAVSAPSSLGRMGPARLRKSCRILKETVTSISSSFWGITLIKKPILLDFLKATTLWKRQRYQVEWGCFLMPLLLKTKRGFVYWLTLGRPGSPEVRLVHHTQQQHPFLLRVVPYWALKPEKIISSNVYSKILNVRVTLRWIITLLSKLIAS